MTPVISNDPQRPVYHFTAPQGWLNDPNGLTRWGNQFHLFYQYNPYSPVHGNIHWGHAVSDDLVHWRHLPIALTPTPGGADADGCWSGCLVNNGGVPTIIYSGNRAGIQRACLATSTDGLLSWHKAPDNPIIPAPPPGLDLVAYRDHSVWREGERWYQLIGAGIAGVGGTALLYHSPDLHHWEYLHPLYTGDLQQYTPFWTGSMWECPDFFALDGRHVLIVSVWDNDVLHYSIAMIGHYAGLRFEAHQLHRLDYGGNTFYAPQSFRDHQGRRLLFGWLQEGRSSAARRAAGWAGVMSLPRELHFTGDGTLHQRPAPELEILRGAWVELAPRRLPADELTVLPEIAGDTLELEVSLVPGAGGRCGLVVRRSPDGEEATLILYDAAQRQLIVERAHTSLANDTDHTAHSAPLSLAPGEPLQLRIFLDHSVLELFANERVSIASRIYPTRSDSLGVALLAEADDAQLIGLSAWQMGSIMQG